MSRNCLGHLLIHLPAAVVTGQTQRQLLVSLRNGGGEAVVDRTGLTSASLNPLLLHTTCLVWAHNSCDCVWRGKEITAAALLLGSP